VLPIVAITTTAGTGTEADPLSVIKKSNSNEKIGYGNRKMSSVRDQENIMLKALGIHSGGRGILPSRLSLCNLSIWQPQGNGETSCFKMCVYPARMAFNDFFCNGESEAAPAYP